MSSKLIKLVRDDTAPALIYALTDKTTGAALDLTGLISAQHKFRLKGTTTVLSTQVLTVYGLPGNGQLQIAWGATDLAVAAGLYEGEIELLLAGSKTLTPYDIVNYVVRDDF